MAKANTAQSSQHYEAEIVEGLEQFAVDELQARFGSAVAIDVEQVGAVRFRYHGHAGKLLALRSVIAVYRLHSFPVSRPKALLGHQNFHTIVGMIAQAQALHHRSDFATLHIDAAGSDSAVMIRLRDELAQSARLVPSPEKGDLHIRIRRGGDGWDVLVRLSPRPLATRAWRVCNYEGALNATVAYAMGRLLAPPPEGGHLLNLMCGSGSLMVEWLALNKANTCFGIDCEPGALACAEQNLNASRYADRWQLHKGDATRTPLPDGGYDFLCVDLPFGQRVGSHDDNLDLYPAVLAEAYRVAAENARLAVITHEVRLFASVVADSGWRVDHEQRVTLRGLHPRLYLLRR